MGYTLYFLNSRDQSPSVIRKWLSDRQNESLGIDEVSPALQKAIAQSLYESGLSFKTYEEDRVSQLDFSNYQLFLFEREIALNIPYWDGRFEDESWVEIEVLTAVLLAHGLTAFDPQTDSVITHVEDLKNEFAINQQAIDRIIGDAPLFDGASLRYIGLGILLLGLIILLWQLT